MTGPRAAALLLASALLVPPACAPPYEAGRLLDDLQSADSDVRQDATERLARILKAGDHEVFLRGARTLEGTARVQSILYLARFEQPEARAALRGLLRAEERALIPWNPIRMKPQSERTDSRILVAHLILQAGGDPEAAAVLLAGAETQPPEILTGTLYALGVLRDPRGLPLLAAAAGSDHEPVARAAVEALGRIRGPEALEALRGASTHALEPVRIDVVSALDARAEPEAADLVRAIAASDPAPEVRAMAIRQLGRHRRPEVIGFLIEQLAGPDALTRQAAHEMLLLLTGESLRPDPRLWSRWWSQNQGRFQPSS
jgi:HEAT repeat protein